jgi:hypothetical protein
MYKKIIFIAFVSIISFSCSNKKKFEGKWVYFDQVTNKIIPQLGFKIDEDDDQFALHFTNGYYEGYYQDSSHLFLGIYNSKENCIEFTMQNNIISKFVYYNKADLIKYGNDCYKKIKE